MREMYETVWRLRTENKELETEVERLIKINQGCEQEAHIQDEILRRYKAENAKLCAVVDAARAYLDQINKRTKSMGLDMSNYHALSITVKPGDAGKDYWQAVWALQQALTELDKEGER